METLYNLRGCDGTGTVIGELPRIGDTITILSSADGERRYKVIAVCRTLRRMSYDSPSRYHEESAPAEVHVEPIT